MKKITTLREAIRRYPKGMIYYHDNQAWVYYKKPVSDETSEEELIKLQVLDGTDWDGNCGYAPDIVVELASLLKIKVDSV